MTQRQEILIEAKPSTKYTWRWRNWRWHSAADLHTREQYSRIGKQMHNNNKVTQLCPQIYLSPPQNSNSLKDTGNNSMHIVFKGELAVKLRAKNVEVGTSADGHPWQDQVTRSWTRPGFTVKDLLTTKALALLRFSIMHQYHALLLNASKLSPCLFRQEQKACLLAYE